MNLSVIICVIFCIGNCLANTFNNLTKEKSVIKYKKEALSSSVISFDLDLLKAFPKLISNSSNLAIEVNLVESKPNPSFLFNLLDINSTIYFNGLLFAPSNLKLDFNFIFGNLTNKLILDYDVKKLKYLVNYIFEFKVHKTSIDKVIKSQEKILNFFKNNLWRKQVTLTQSEINNELAIVYISPEKNFDKKKATSFKIMIGSKYPVSEKLEDLSFKNSRIECNQINNTKLNEFESETGFKLDVCSIKIFESSFDSYDQNGPKLNFTLNANYTIKAYNRTEYDLQFLNLILLNDTNENALFSLIQFHQIHESLLGFIVIQFFQIFFIEIAYIFGVISSALLIIYVIYVFF